MTDTEMPAPAGTVSATAGTGTAGTGSAGTGSAGTGTTPPDAGAPEIPEITEDTPANWNESPELDGEGGYLTREEIDAREARLREEAARWLDSAVWRMMLYSDKFRAKVVGDKIERTRLPRRIRRFVAGCPRHCMRQAMDLLLERAPYRNIRLDQVVETDAVYRPTLTYWSRDMKSYTNTKTGDSTCTLVQDLILDDDGAKDTLQVGSGGNCTSAETVEFVWDAAEVPDASSLDGYGDAGKTIYIRGVSRDSETGLFSYQIVTTTTKTQHTPFRKLKDSPQGLSVYREEWKGLYAGAMTAADVLEHKDYAGRYGLEEGDACFRDDAGNLEEVPVAGSYEVPADPPVPYTVELDLRQAEDCTYAVAATYTHRDTGVVLSFACAETIYQHEHSDTGLTDKPADHVDEAGLEKVSEGADGKPVMHGMHRQRRSEKTDTGEWATTESYTEELPVEESVVTVESTVKGVRTTTVNRNMDAAEPVENLAVGEAVKNEKNPGGSFNTTRVRFTVNKDPVGEGCRKTIFDHADTDVAYGDAAAGCAPNAGGTPGDPDESGAPGTDGKSYQYTSRQDPETGKWENTLVENREIWVQKASERVTTTPKGTVTAVTHRNCKARLAAPEGTKTAEYRRTDGGRYDVTFVTGLPPAEEGDTGETCARVVDSHVHAGVTDGLKDVDLEKAHTEAPGVKTDPANSLSSGHHQEIRFVQDPDTGSWTRQIQDTYETHKADFIVGKVSNARSATVQGLDRHALKNDIGDPSEPFGFDRGEYWTVDRADGTVTHVTYDAAAHADHTVVRKKRSTNPGTSYDNETERDIPHKHMWYREIEVARTWRGVWNYRNFKDAEVLALIDDVAKVLLGACAYTGADLTPLTGAGDVEPGYHDFVASSVPEAGCPPGYGVAVKLRRLRNRRYRRDYVSGGKVTGSVVLYPYEDYDVTCNDTLNEYGLYDGSITAVVRYRRPTGSPGGGGGGGDPDLNIYDRVYSTVDFSSHVTSVPKSPASLKGNTAGDKSMMDHFLVAVTTTRYIWDKAGTGIAEGEALYGLGDPDMKHFTGSSFTSDSTRDYYVFRWVFQIENAVSEVRLGSGEELDFTLSNKYPKVDPTAPKPKPKGDK